MNNSFAVRIAALLLLPLILGMTMSGRNLLRNGDFEKFTGDEPEGWATTNIPKMLTIVSAVPGQHGKLAVKCEVKPFYGTQMAGMVMQKNIPISGSSASLTGSYAMTSTGGDVGYVTMEMRNGEGSSVRVCHENLPTTGGVWKTFTLSGSISSEVVSAELRLTIIGRDDGTIHEGSMVVFDDVVLVAGGDEKPGV
jgi:hypothetical protein